MSLERLSLDSNDLRTLPIEICALSRLRELRISKNHLERLPLELGFLSNLEELHVPLNRLRELPEVEPDIYVYITGMQTRPIYSNYPFQSIGKCYHLKILDVAANDLRIFPTEMEQLPLEELHCEGNPLLSHLPVSSVQEEEVLSLKEITARYIMKSLKDR